MTGVPIPFQILNFLFFIFLRINSYIAPLISFSVLVFLFTSTGKNVHLDFETSYLTGRNNSIQSVGAFSVNIFVDRAGNWRGRLVSRTGHVAHVPPADF